MWDVADLQLLDEALRAELEVDEELWRLSVRTEPIEMGRCVRGWLYGSRGGVAELVE